MASLVFNSFLDDLCKGNVNPNADTFWLMLVTDVYTPDKDTHTKRSHVTNEVVGAGYSADGKVCALTVALVTATDKETISLGTVSWPAATITARAGVLYKRRGGLSSADELVAYIDFGGNVTSTGGTFEFTATSPLTLQN